MGVEIVTVGTITKDSISSGKAHFSSFGGAPFFASLIFSEFGIKCGVVSKVGRDFKQSLFDRKFVDMCGMKFVDNTTEMNINETKEDTTAKLSKFTGSLALSLVPKSFMCAGCFLISPLAGEVSLRMISGIRSRSSGIIALDIQGFTRPRLRKGKSRVLSDAVKKRPKNLEKLLENVDVLKCNELEFDIISGRGTALQRARRLAKLGPKTIVITMGEKGVAVFSENRMRRFSPKKLRPAHTVGAGDKFFALFLSHFLRTGDAFLSASQATDSVQSLLAKNGDRYD